MASGSGRPAAAVLPKQAELDPRVANIDGDEGGLETDDHFVGNHGLRLK